MRLMQVNMASMRIIDEHLDWPAVGVRTTRFTQLPTE
jgi:hypothetical protein